MARLTKKATLRQRLIEEEQKAREAETEMSFKKRLVRVTIRTKPFSLLHGMMISYCGYCGKPMDIFSGRPLILGERLPPLYYACRDKCQSSSFQRTDFVDRLLMQLIQTKIKQNFKMPQKSGDIGELLQKFRYIEDLLSRRLDLLGKMHYASYKRDIVLAEIRELDDEIRIKQSEIKDLFSAELDENPLVYPLFATPPEQLNDLDLVYRRELVRTIVNRLRFFNEYILVRMIPFSEEEKRMSDSMGTISNIHLRVTERKYGAILESVDVEKGETLISAENANEKKDN